MIKIFYPHEDHITEITERLIDANIGYDLIQKPDLMEVMIQEGNNTYQGQQQTTDFITMFLDEVKGWGHCVCEDG